MAKKKSAGYRFGSHMSIAGGYYRAVEAAAEIGCDCVQLFTKNSNQWNAKPISQDEVERFTEALSSLGIVAPLSHASYLINLASPDDALWEKSIAAMVIEWQRAEQLGLDGVVVHPGAFVSSSESQGLDRIAQALQRIASDVMPAHSWLLLENTAGQGSCLGRTMEQLDACRCLHRYLPCPCGRLRHESTRGTGRTSQPDRSVDRIGRRPGGPPKRQQEGVWIPSRSP
jgi:deoxyribonuclease-4